MNKKFRNAARFVVINEQDQILLVEMGKYWALPGGGIDFGESIIHALQRESMEELGVKALPGKMIFMQDYVTIHKGEESHCTEYFYTIQNNSDFENIEEKYTIASHAFELKSARFFAVGDFPENLMPKAFPKIIRKYLKNKENFECEYVSEL